MKNPSEQQMANAIRMLSADAVELAKSGHPGAPMGMADIATVLWTKHLRHNPNNPNWLNRDRFVLSNGHGSMLVYALLHLTGYDISIEDIKQFRQLHSKTPGHPELGLTPGIETTTGPLGQGLANAVGMALAEKILAATYNTDTHTIIDHHTYAFIGDGCLMEGISHEVCSLAGVLQLNKLIVIYDDNGISIDGAVAPWFNDDTAARFRAYHWNVIDNIDGHNPAQIDAALRQAKTANAATLICCKTIIGKGAPNKQGSGGVHGAPLGAAELQATRATLNWPHPPFAIPAAIKSAWDMSNNGAILEADWQQTFAAYSQAAPAQAAELLRRVAGVLPPDFSTVATAYINQARSGTQKIATRKASQLALSAYAPTMPELFGGSADLTGSNLTNFTGCIAHTGQQIGNHLSYGVREFGMAAIANGIALHGGFIPYVGTFLVFSDYCRNAIRMSALMHQRIIYVFTHDSIGLGEDGPTHQPIEHLASLRLIPNLTLWRPADAAETAVAWQQAIAHADGPSVLCLTRQGLESVTQQFHHDIHTGGYLLNDMDNAKVTLLASGSEVEICCQAQQLLREQNIAARVVSMPSTSVFDRQSTQYQQQVLGKLPIIAIEAGHPDGLRKYVGNGVSLGISTFGESAPINDLYSHFGLTAAQIVAQAKKLMQP